VLEAGADEVVLVDTMEVILLSEQLVKASRVSNEPSMEKLLADLEKYRRMALELGATDAKVIPASMVTVDERVRLKCSFPRCHLYGETPNCPPYTPEPEFMRKALSKYSYAVLFSAAKRRFCR
jgi:hypothetical protein